jgi:hypothetical protein
MFKYKILIKLFVLNCVFVRCVYVDTVQMDVVVSFLLVWLYSLVMRHRHMHTHARIHKVLILYGCKSIFEYKRILFRALHEIICLVVQVLPPKEQSWSETFIQRCIVTGTGYENLKENFINAISGVTLVHQSPWGHYVTILLNMNANFRISGKISLTKWE